MNLVDKIKKYLKDNPHLLTSKYADTAKKFGTNYEQIRGIAREIRKKNPETSNMIRHLYLHLHDFLLFHSFDLIVLNQK